MLSNCLHNWPLYKKGVVLQLHEAIFWYKHWINKSLSVVWKDCRSCQSHWEPTSHSTAVCSFRNCRTGVQQSFHCQVPYFSIIALVLWLSTIGDTSRLGKKEWKLCIKSKKTKNFYLPQKHFASRTRDRGRWMRSWLALTTICYKPRLLHWKSSATVQSDSCRLGLKTELLYSTHVLITTHVNYILWAVASMIPNCYRLSLGVYLYAVVLTAPFISDYEKQPHDDEATAMPYNRNGVIWVINCASFLPYFLQCFELQLKTSMFIFITIRIFLRTLSVVFEVPFCKFHVPFSGVISSWPLCRKAWICEVLPWLLSFQEDLTANELIRSVRAVLGFWPRSFSTGCSVC